MSIEARHARFENREVVVTGGASGIGLAIVRGFLAEGAHVYIVDRDESAWLAAKADLPDRADDGEFLCCDVSNFDSVREAIARIPGGLDVLVNNAGVSHVGNLGNTSEQDFDRLYQVNVKGLFNTSRACIEKMITAGGGAIVNMASVAALVGIPDRFAYSMTKGAVVAMTRSIACDYLRYGIRCNAISPARVHTPFVDQFLAKAYPGREKEMFDTLAATQPIGRMGKPGEVAALALYLCSAEAAFITGSDFPIDGGFTGVKV